MKKALSILLALALLLLAACGSDANNSSSNASNENTAPATADSAAPSAGGEDAEETAPADEEIVIGMATYMMAQEWYQNIVTGAQNQAEKLGVTLLVADANNDSATQVAAIENFIAQGVDAIVVSPVDAKSLTTVIAQAKDAGIMVVCESNMVEGADTRIGVSDFDSAKKTGEWFADYAQANGIEPQILILGYKSLENCRNRVDGFKAGLDEKGLNYTIATEVDGGFRAESTDATTDALTANPEINAVFGINDDSTLGAISAIKQAGKSTDDIVTILYGLEGVAGRSALQEGTAIAGLSMFPEYVGTTCINAAMDAIEGKELPEVYMSPTIVVEAKDFDTFFEDTDGDGMYEVNFDAVEALG